MSKLNAARKQTTTLPMIIVRAIEALALFAVGIFFARRWLHEILSNSKETRGAIKLLEVIGVAVGLALVAIVTFRNGRRADKS